MSAPCCPIYGISRKRLDRRGFVGNVQGDKFALGVTFVVIRVVLGQNVGGVKEIEQQQ